MRRDATLHANRDACLQGTRFRTRSALLGVLALVLVDVVVGRFSSTLLAQSRPPRLLAPRECHCGRWTCPICQSQCACPPPAPNEGIWFPPGTPCVPSPLPLPSVVTPGAPGQAAPVAPMVPAPSDAGQQAQPGAAPEAQAPSLTAPTPSADLGAGAPGPSSLASLAGGAGSDVGIPNMIGDGFGSGQSVSILSNTVNYAFPAFGYVVAGGSGLSNSVIIFETTDGTPDDLVTSGPGTDTNNDGFADTFPVAEPVAPTDAPTSPGSTFTYDGGTATYPNGAFASVDTWNIAYSYSEPIPVILPSPSGGGAVVGRMKIAENTSPLPRNRIFFNYSLFDNVPLLAQGVSVNRYSPGFETTFANGLHSFEMRVPFAATADTEVFADGPTRRNEVKLGDLFMAWKSLLWRDDDTILSGGLAMSVPTADDLNVSLRNGTPLLSVTNETVHLMPFVGGYQQYQSGAFTQGFIQVDIDANGNPVLANLRGRGLTEVGRIHDVTFLYVDWGVGYRYRPTSARAAYLTQVMPTLELHYTRSLQDTDVIQVGNFRIGQFKERTQILNVVAGSTFVFNQRSYLTLGFGLPVGNGSDQQFDGELRAIWNRLY